MGMNRFDEQLLRLKQVLGLTKDHEVASALGLSKAAFSNRKQKGNFPSELVIKLLSNRSDAELMYVLTGARWDSDETLMEDIMARGALEAGDQRRLASVARLYHNSKQFLQEAVDHRPVRELLRVLCFCDDETIDDLRRIAAARMGPHPILFSQRGGVQKRRPEEIPPSHRR